MLKKIASSLTGLSTLFVMMMLIIAFYVPANAQSGNACREELTRENRRYTEELKRLQEEAYQLLKQHRSTKQIEEQLQEEGKKHKRNVDEIVRSYGDACPRALRGGK